ncbi:hypothetical protein ACM5Q3_14860, partial [Enterococcus gallinarum]
AFLPVAGISEEQLADAAQLSSLADETAEGRSIVILAIAGDINCDTDSKGVNFPQYDFTHLKILANQYDAWLDGNAIKKGESTTNPSQKTRIDRIFTNLTIKYIEHSWNEFESLSDHAVIFSELQLKDVADN